MDGLFIIRRIMDIVIALLSIFVFVIVVILYHMEFKTQWEARVF